MSLFVKLASEIWRDYETDGVPSSGAHKLIKPDIRAWAATVEAGVTAGIAIKAPVRTVATANITLSGTQMVSAVALVAGDRALAQNQTDPTTNGIYDVAAGAWTRSADSANSSQFVRGCQVRVNEGTYANTLWWLATADPITLGTSNITWIAALSALNLPVASSSALGVVQGDGATLSISGPGVISVNQGNAFSWTALHTFTVAAANAIRVRSGASGSFAQVSLGRTSDELAIAIVGASNQYTPFTSPGDSVIEPAGPLWLLPGNASGTSSIGLLGTLNIAPLQGSLTKGLSITQVGPTSGSSAGPYAFNLINVTYNSTTTGAGLDSFGINNTYAAAFRVNYTVGGANLSAQGIANALFATRVTSGVVNPNGDIMSVVATNYTNQSIPGGFGLYAFVGSVVTDVGGIVTDNICCDLSVSHLGTVTRSAGVRITLASSIRGTGVAPTSYGSAVLFASTGQQAASWDHLFALQSSEGLTTNPLKSTGDYFFSEASYTIQHWANLSNLTVTGNILSFPNVTLSGGAVLSLTKAGSDAITVRSGASGSLAQISVGRTANEHVHGVAGASNQYFSGTVAGDAIVYAAGNLWLGANSGTPGLEIKTTGAIKLPTGYSTGVLVSDSSGNITSSGTPTLTSLAFSPTTGGIVGTVTNDNASAGTVGEYVSSTVALGSEVSLTTATGASVTSISLTAGDWDVWVEAYFVAGATSNIVSAYAGISTTNNTFDFTYGRYASVQYGTSGLVVGAATIAFAVAALRVSLSATTTYYFVAYTVFTVSTFKVGGIIAARRRR